MRRLTPWLSSSRCWNGWLGRLVLIPAMTSTGRPIVAGEPPFPPPESRTPHPYPAKSMSSRLALQRATIASSRRCRRTARRPHRSPRCRELPAPSVDAPATGGRWRRPYWCADDRGNCRTCCRSRTLALTPSGRRPHRRRQAVAARRLPAPLPLPNSLESLLLFQVVSIQPSERWMCAIWNSSIWPLAAAIRWSPSPLRSAGDRRRPHTCL